MHIGKKNLTLFNDQVDKITDRSAVEALKSKVGTINSRYMMISDADLKKIKLGTAALDAGMFKTVPKWRVGLERVLRFFGCESDNLFNTKKCLKSLEGRVKSLTPGTPAATTATNVATVAQAIKQEVEDHEETERRKINTYIAEKDAEITAHGGSTPIKILGQSQAKETTVPPTKARKEQFPATGEMQLLGKNNIVATYDKSKLAGSDKAIQLFLTKLEWSLRTQAIKKEKFDKKGMKVAEEITSRAEEYAQQAMQDSGEKLSGTFTMTYKENPISIDVK